MRSTYAMYAPLVEEGQALFSGHTLPELTAMRDLLDAMRRLHRPSSGRDDDQRTHRCRSMIGGCPGSVR